jgi:hypothetical protein
MRFVIEVRIEDGDHPLPPPVTVGVIERSADLTPASGLGLFLQETKDLLRELQAVVVAGQTAQFVSAASKCRTCSTTLGVKDRKQLVYRTAFGIARLASPRLYSRCARCGTMAGRANTVSPLAEALPRTDASAVDVVAVSLCQRHVLSPGADISSGRVSCRQEPGGLQPQSQPASCRESAGGRGSGRCSTRCLAAHAQSQGRITQADGRGATD